MSEVTTQAESSPAVEVDPFNGQTPTLREFNAYRVSGEVPARFAPAEDAESAPANTTQAEGDEPENEPAAATGDDQELLKGIGSRPRKRIEQLLAEKKELERKLAEHAKPDATPAPSPAPTAQQSALLRPEPTIDDKNADGTPKYVDLSAFVKDLGRWSAEQTLHEAKQRDSQQQETRKIQENIEEARKRYGDEFEKVIEPTAAAIMGNKSIPMEVKQMMAQSDVLPELVYTIGTDQKTKTELERLARTNPSQAIRYIATLEVGIRAELAADPDPKSSPEPRKTTAPKPPSPVTGASSRAFDVSDESLSAEDWMRKRNQQLARRGQS